MQKFIISTEYGPQKTKADTVLVPWLTGKRNKLISGGKYVPTIVARKTFFRNIPWLLSTLKNKKTVFAVTGNKEHGKLKDCNVFRLISEISKKKKVFVAIDMHRSHEKERIARKIKAGAVGAYTQPYFSEYKKKLECILKVLPKNFILLVGLYIPRTNKEAIYHNINTPGFKTPNSFIKNTEKLAVINNNILEVKELRKKYPQIKGIHFYGDLRQLKFLL